MLAGRRQVSWLAGLPLAAPSRKTNASSGLGLSTTCGGLTRLQWRDRAGFSPDFPSPPTVFYAWLKVSVSDSVGATPHKLAAGGTFRYGGRALTVNLTRIYTRLGDDGETHLGDMSRVEKTHPRIEAYGTVDELNANIGVAVALESMPKEFHDWLGRIQNDLFDVGADAAVPEGEANRDRLRLLPEQTTWLEERCDEVNSKLEPLTSFVLPGGTAAAAQLHVCRTVCRRAERLAVACEGISPEVVRYLNRLSDLLFILARAANGGKEILWQPGLSRPDGGRPAES